MSPDPRSSPPTLAGRRSPGSLDGAPRSAYVQRRQPPDPLQAAGILRLPRVDRSLPPETIRKFRERFDLTQHDLGELLCLGKNAIGSYESAGAPGWMRFALVGIAKLRYGVPAEDLGWLGQHTPTRRSARAPSGAGA